MIPLVSITVKQGDIDGLPLAVTGSDGLPLDLSDATLNFRAWEEGTDVDLIGPQELTILDPPEAGQARLTLLPLAIADLDPDKRYWYDVKLVGGSTVAEGRLYVEAERIR